MDSKVKCQYCRWQIIYSSEKWCNCIFDIFEYKSSFSTAFYFQAKERKLSPIPLKSPDLRDQLLEQIRSDQHKLRPTPGRVGRYPTCNSCKSCFILSLSIRGRPLMIWGGAGGNREKKAEWLCRGKNFHMEGGPGKK